MRNRNYTTALPALLCLMLSGCYIDIDGLDPVVDGSGDIVAEERMLESFDRIVTEGSLELVISQDTEQLVEVEADDNLLQYIRTSVRGGTLWVSNTRTFSSNRYVKVFITLTELEALEIRGSSNVFGSSVISGDNLDLEIDGAGNVDMELFYDRIYSEIDGSGNFRLSGEVLEQEVRIKGSGDYRAADLLSIEADVQINGSGNSIVRVSDFLRAEIRGSGDIIYYGDPDVESFINGSGNLQQR